MMNSVLEGFSQRRLDDIHFEIRLTTLSNCAMEVEKELGRRMCLLTAVILKFLQNVFICSRVYNFKIGLHLILKFITK